MAFIEPIQRKKGTSHAIRFYYRGKQRKIVLDTAYTRSDVDAALAAVEGVLRSERLEEPLDRKTRAFFETAPADLLRRFSVFGFVAAKQNLTVSDVWKLYERTCMTTNKEGTVVHRETVYARFRAFFPQDVRFSDLTPAAVLEFRDELERLYAPTTVNRSIGDLRTFGKWAVDRGYATENPFLAVRRGPTGNRSRDFQIPAEWTERILEACPSQSWRTLYCLWRHAGLRQQEPLALRRESVDLRARRLMVHSSKTERYGENHADRVVPIAPVLFRELTKQLDELPAAEAFLIYENRRKGFDSGFRRILFDAGLDRWPKLFQILRSSCENDWIRDGIPSHVVASWMGHSVRTQETYYLRILPEYFDRVVC